MLHMQSTIAGEDDAFVAKLNLSEPTAVGLVGLAAAPSGRASLFAPWLLVAVLLGSILLILGYRRSRQASPSGAKPSQQE